MVPSFYPSTTQTMNRPQTLYDVSRRVAAGDMELGPVVREFLDTFYGADDVKRGAIISRRPLKLDPVCLFGCHGRPRMDGASGKRTRQGAFQRRIGEPQGNLDR